MTSIFVSVQVALFSPKPPADGITLSHSLAAGLSASGTADSEWEAAIFQHISTAGPVKLGGLGSVVKKPAGVTKKLKQLVIESKRLSLGQGDEVKLA